VTGAGPHSPNEVCLLHLIFGVVSDARTIEVFDALDRRKMGRVYWDDFFRECAYAFGPEVMGVTLPPSEEEGDENDPMGTAAVPLPGPLSANQSAQLHAKLHVSSGAAEAATWAEARSGGGVRGGENEGASLPLVRGDRPGAHWTTPEGVCLLPCAVKVAGHGRVKAQKSRDDECGASGESYRYGGGETVSLRAPPEPPPLTSKMLYTFVYDAIDRKKKGWFSKHDLIRSLGPCSPVTMVFGRLSPTQGVKVFHRLDELDGKDPRSGRVSRAAFFKHVEDVVVAVLDEPDDLMRASGPVYGPDGQKIARKTEEANRKDRVDGVNRTEDGEERKGGD
jgi:hypothetical protein